MKVKLLKPGAQAPKKMKVGDAGFDVFSPEDHVLKPGQLKQIKLGISVEVAADDVVITSERSGMALKGLHTVGNVIDSNYRGEISIILHNVSSSNYGIAAGDRIGQLIITKLGYQGLEVVDALSESERGASAHGSSGL